MIDGGNRSRKASAAEQTQADHYDEIIVDYEAHYSDPCSREYRRRFFYDPMFQGIDLRGKAVLEALCGSGPTARYLLEQGAVVTGLDISPGAIAMFREKCPDCAAYCRSILDSGFPDESFDCVAVVGALHHLHPHLNDALREVHRILKPGGYLCFMEPHAGSFFDWGRKIWYKFDKYFADNEASIDVNALKREFIGEFDFARTSYGGNLAFLTVYNSLIFRIPVKLKPYYSPLFMWVESVVSKVQWKFDSCFVLAQWRKSAGSRETGCERKGAEVIG
ncbi:MAG: methyltransferase domain-containing protein [Pyrinomonadaceae bacterium]